MAKACFSGKVIVEALPVGGTNPEERRIILSAGNCKMLYTYVAHAFMSLYYTQVMEFSPGHYDPGDTKSYNLIRKDTK